MLSLIPASLLVSRRVAAEGSEVTVTMLMDGEALNEQAALLGRDPFSLALEYQQVGLNGIILYEDTPETLADKGRIIALDGRQFNAMVLLAGLADAPVLPERSTVLSELEPGALSPLLRKSATVPEQFSLLGRDWYWFSGDSLETRPAGPDREELRRYAAAGFDIAWRPRNFPGLTDPGADFPEEANYLIHYGLELAGNPDALPQLVEASQSYITGIIEGTEQAGMDEVVDDIPTVRLLSFSQEHVNRGLDAEEISPKYALAASERGIRIMYLRPWTEEHMGNMYDNTAAMVGMVRDQLEAEGFTIGPLDLGPVDYEPSLLLRSLSGLGVVAGLGLLGLAYPGIWAGIVALAVALLCVAAAGLYWSALALAAALVFPVLGYVYLRENIASLFLATLISLAGAVLLAATGSEFATMMAITPFQGVAATLVVPPALYVFQYALRYRRPVQWVRDFAGQPLTIGLVALLLIVGAAAGLILLRRGNFPIIGASEAELALRAWLNELFVRPRFKELVGHAVAVVGLLVRSLPVWLRAGLLTAGVVAQATILNSFSHYHTPLVISLQRTVIALVLGFLVGLLLSAVTAWAAGAWQRWLGSAARFDDRKR